MNAEELEGRITAPYERSLTTTVDNIEHIESSTVAGQAIIKVFLQPHARLDTANAQVTAISQNVLRQFPTGTLPPLVINYSASSVPILQLALSGEGLNEQQLYDLAANFLRPQLATVPGAAMVGPDYQRPSVPMTESYKEMEGWKVAQPRDAAPRGPWWEIFDDPELNALEEQVAAANQDLMMVSGSIASARPGVAKPMIRLTIRARDRSRNARFMVFMATTITDDARFPSAAHTRLRTAARSS